MTLLAGQTAALPRLLAAIGVVVVADMGLTYWSGHASYVFGETVFAQLREEAVDGVVGLPLETVERAGTGDLLGRTTGDIKQVSGFIQNDLTLTVVTLINLVAVGVAICWTAPIMVGAIVLTGVGLWLTTRRYLRYSIPAYRAAAESRADADGLTNETLAQHTTVDAAGLGRVREGRVRTVLREFQRNEVYTAIQRSRFAAVMRILIYVPACCAVFAGPLLLRHGLTPGGLATLVMYCLQLAGPLQTISWLMDSIQYASVALQRIFGISLAPHVPEGNEEPRGTEIRVEGATFWYDDAGARPALRDVTVSVVPGERLTIVGTSGAGKSTLVRLMAGLGEPQRGRVTIGGVDVSRIPEARLRRLVALVTQENYVFTGTVADNLRLARENATDAELRRVLDTVELDVPLDREVNNGALRPGEAQQLALARVLLRDPSIVILDEATAAMSAVSARATERALAAVLRGRTVISVAHRLFSVDSADRIAVMNDGRIVEIGSHRELLARGGQYAALWHAWEGA